MERVIAPITEINEMGASRLELANKQALEMDEIGQLSQADLDRFTAESIHHLLKESQPEFGDKVIQIGKQAVELVTAPLRNAA